MTGFVAMPGSMGPWTGGRFDGAHVCPGRQPRSDDPGRDEHLADRRRRAIRWSWSIPVRTTRAHLRRVRARARRAPGARDPAHARPRRPQCRGAAVRRMRCGDGCGRWTRRIGCGDEGLAAGEVVVHGDARDPRRRHARAHRRLGDPVPARGSGAADRRHHPGPRDHRGRPSRRPPGRLPRHRCSGCPTWSRRRVRRRCGRATGRYCTTPPRCWPRTWSTAGNASTEVRAAVAGTGSGAAHRRRSLRGSWRRSTPTCRGCCGRPRP